LVASQDCIQVGEHLSYILVEVSDTVQGLKLWVALRSKDLFTISLK